MAESIYEGTWASGDPPSEVIDFMLMEPDGMNWTWEALQNTPTYVRRYCWDLLQIKRRAQQDQIEKAGRKRANHGAGPGPHR